MKKSFLGKPFLSLLLVVAFMFIYSLNNRAYAAFNGNLIMSDAVFDNVNSMNEGDIQNFLNGFPSSCLKNYQAPYPNNYFSYGGNVPASRVIRRVADLWGMNPQVILATLEKEESLVSGSAGCPDWRYNSAMGMGCPDGGACPAPAYAGFHQQVTKGSWQLKFNKERALGNVGWDSPIDPDDDRYLTYPGPMTQGWRSRVYGGPATYYDGYHNIDGQVVHLDSGATASFYWYTPHFHGNQNLVLLFERWFGSTIEANVPAYRWAYEGQWAYSDSQMTQPFSSVPTTTPNGTIYLKLRARNTGTHTWNNSNVRLGTSRPQDRDSAFASNNWVSNRRATNLQESSVAPGETGTFIFEMKAPMTVGTYNEYFNLLTEGVTWFNDPGLYYSINVNNASSPSATNHTLSSGQSLSTDQYLLSQDKQSVLRLGGGLKLYSNFQSIWSVGSANNSHLLVMQTDGNLVLYDNTSKPVWNTETFGNPGAWLALQVDGNMVVYSASNTPLWASYTIHNPSHLSYINTYLSTNGQSSGLLFPNQEITTVDKKYRLILQPDGNLVLYFQTRALWSTATDGKSVSFLALQPDGNLVLYDNASKPIWHSHTVGGERSRLVLQPDGNLVLYDMYNRPRWHTATQGMQ